LRLVEIEFFHDFCPIAFRCSNEHQRWMLPGKRRFRS
jgi:hypothetical protein